MMKNQKITKLLLIITILLIVCSLDTKISCMVIGEEAYQTILGEKRQDKTILIENPIKLFVLADLCDAIKYSFINLPEHKQGDFCGNLNYKRSYGEYFWGQRCCYLEPLMNQFCKTYENRPEIYIEKKLVANKSKIIVMGDIHGSLHSLLRNLLRIKNDGFLDNNWKLTPNTYLVFTGDYIDRGYYGLEVLLFLMKLRVENPENVYLLRGNHETIEICSQFGFLKELVLKFFGVRLEKNLQDLPEEKDKVKIIKLLNIFENKIFQKLPRSLFLGTLDKDLKPNWIQFVHGSIVVDELKGKIVQPVLDDIQEEKIPENTVSIKNFLENSETFTEISIGEEIQYLWGSFNFDKGYKITKRGVGFDIGMHLIDAYCQNLNICKICHGHDHCVGGITFLNPNFNYDLPEDFLNLKFLPIDIHCGNNQKIFTFMSCPEGLGMGNMNEDAYGIWSFDGIRWNLYPNIFNRSIYKGFEEDSDAFWYVIPDGQNSFTLINSKPSENQFNISDDGQDDGVVFKIEDE